MVLPPVDHDCSLKDFVAELANRIAKLEQDYAQLMKALVGPKSERQKMPRPPGKMPTPEETKAARAARAKDRTEIQSLRTFHKVPDEMRTSDDFCLSCIAESGMTTTPMPATMVSGTSPFW